MKLSLNDAQVVASHRIETMADTNATPLDTGNLEDYSKIPENAFLIVEGVKVFPLKLPVVNIGRRLDNQLIIDDPRVSRNHAQLRAIKGRFVVFDLNSTRRNVCQRTASQSGRALSRRRDLACRCSPDLRAGQPASPPRPERYRSLPERHGRATHSGAKRTLHG